MIALGEEGPELRDLLQPDDFVTVARAADRKLMTKVFLVDGEGHEQARSYDKGYLFNFSTPAIACLDDLAHVLDGLDRHSCVIYGRPIKGTVTPCRRLLKADAEKGDPAAIEDTAHSWLLVDIDELAIEGDVFDPVAEPERAIKYIRAKLPSEFHGARCLWRLTSSAGVEKRTAACVSASGSRALTGSDASHARSCGAESAHPRWLSNRMQQGSPAGRAHDNPAPDAFIDKARPTRLK